MDDFLWTHTHEDIISSIELKVSYEHTIIVQNYENLMLTAQAVFGKSDSSPRIDENTIIAETGDEIENAFRALGWIGGG